MFNKREIKMKTDNGKKEDLRIIKTKRRLSQSLMDMLSEVPFDKIKVSDLCERSGISRATFYNNFDSTKEVLQYHLETFREEIQSKIVEEKDEKNLDFSDTYRLMLSLIISTLSEKRQILKEVIEKHPSSVIYYVIQKFALSSINRVLEMFKEEISSIPLPIISNYLAGAFTGLVIYLISSGDNYSKEQMVNYVYNLTFDNFYQVLSKKSLLN